MITGNLKLSDTKGWKFAELFRVGKWPTFFSEGWKVADSFLRDGKLPTNTFYKK